MNPDDTTKLYQIIENTLGCDRKDLTPETEFLSDLNASREELEQLVNEVENVFDIECEPPKNPLKTVGDLMQLVEEAQI